MSLAPSYLVRGVSSVRACVQVWEGVSQCERVFQCERVCRSIGGCVPVREGLPQRRRVGGMCMCPCHMCSWVRGWVMCTIVHVHECHCHMYLLVYRHVTVTVLMTVMCECYRHVLMTDTQVHLCVHQCLLWWPLHNSFPKPAAGIVCSSEWEGKCPLTQSKPKGIEPKHLMYSPLWMGPHNTCTYVANQLDPDAVTCTHAASLVIALLAILFSSLIMHVCQHACLNVLHSYIIAILLLYTYGYVCSV